IRHVLATPRTDQREAGPVRRPRSPFWPLIACEDPVTETSAFPVPPRPCITVMLMSPDASVALQGHQAAPQRTHNRLKLAVIDRDPGFMQVLNHRLEALGWEHRELS